MFRLHIFTSIHLSSLTRSILLCACGHPAGLDSCRKYYSLSQIHQKRDGNIDLCSESLLSRAIGANTCEKNMGSWMGRGRGKTWWTCNKSLSRLHREMWSYTCSLELSRTEAGPGLCMPAISLVIGWELFLLLRAVAEEALSCEPLVANTPGSL